MKNSNFKTIDDYYEKAFGNYESKLEDNKIKENIINNTDHSKINSKDYSVSMYTFFNLQGKITKNQNGWNKYFKNVNKVYFASMSDMYRVFKQINEDLEANTTNILASHLKQKLLQDIVDHGIVTSSKILYEMDSLNGIITHRSNNIIKQIPTLIPLYESFQIKKIKASQINECENYLKALFDTDDSFDEINKVLRNFLNHTENNTILTTELLINRHDRKSSELSIDFGGNVFHFGSDYGKSLRCCEMTGERLPIDAKEEKYILQK